MTELKMMVRLEAYVDGNMGLDENMQTIKRQPFFCFAAKICVARIRLRFFRKKTGIKMGIVNIFNKMRASSEHFPSTTDRILMRNSKNASNPNGHSVNNISGSHLLRLKSAENHGSWPDPTDLPSEQND